MKKHILVQLALLAMTLGACMTAGSSVQAGTPPFRYDAATGKCLNSAGQSGHNPAVPETLFAHHDTATNSYKNGDAECVDFTAFNFNTTIGMSYPVLDHWNFRGAVFSKARFFFANMQDADVSGADLREIKYGYATLTGKGDAHTQGGACIVKPDFSINCTR